MWQNKRSDLSPLTKVRDYIWNFGVSDKISHQPRHAPNIQHAHHTYQQKERWAEYDAALKKREEKKRRNVSG